MLLLVPARQNTQRKRELRSLTPLRGIAALWVIFYHFGTISFPNLHIDRYSQILAKGYLAVDLFFLLSGFVLAHVYRDAFSGSITKAYRSFFVARFARLYPLHLFVLLLFLMMTLAFFAFHYFEAGQLQSIPLVGPQSLTALLANLAMMQGLQASELSWNYPAWSISTEFIAYLALPFWLAWVLGARFGIKCCAALILLASLLMFAYLTGDDFNQWNGPQTLLRCLPEFLLGALLYQLYLDGRSGIPRDVLLLPAILAILSFLHFGVSDFVTVLGFSILLLLLVADNGVLAAILNTRPLLWLGEISYSLYLVHGFVQFVTDKALVATGVHDPAILSYTTSLECALAMFAMTVLIASITYYGVELPSRRFLRERLQLRQSQQVADKSAAGGLVRI